MMLRGRFATAARAMQISFKKKKALLGLGVLVLAAAGMALFAIAAQEQSILSSGTPATDAVRLQDLITRAPGSNKHIELSDFYFGRQYIYAAKLVQFKDVYLPVFPNGSAETGDHLQLLLWIRNDRHSNQRLIQSGQDLDRFVADFSRDPRRIAGVLLRPIDRVRTMTADAYPGTNSKALQVLWARDFPDEPSVQILWLCVILCLVAAAACGIAYRRVSRLPRN